LTRRLGDGKRVILTQGVPGSVRANRAVRNTQVFQMETRVVADISSVVYTAPPFVVKSLPTESR
jgi:hypothetical protein